MGHSLGKELDAIFGTRSTMCVLLASEHYVAKEWTTHELKAALRAMGRRPGYIVPVQIDGTKIAELPDDTTYLPIGLGVAAISEAIVERLNRS